VARALTLSLRAGPGVSTIVGVSEPAVRRDDLQAAIEARQELGAEMEPAVIDAFVERIERRLEARSGESETSLKRKREHQKEMVLGAMGISVPLFAIAAIFAGIAGVIAVCAALAVIAIATR
jgi:Flp pilus assembly protein TadB